MCTNFTYPNKCTDGYSVGLIGWGCFTKIKMFADIIDLMYLMYLSYCVNSSQDVYESNMKEAVHCYE